MYVHWFCCCFVLLLCNCVVATITQFRRQRHLVAKSGTKSGQLDIYKSDVRSAWHLQSDIPRSDVPPLVEVSGGQEQYYVRSSWHVEVMQLRRQWTVKMYPHRGIWWTRMLWPPNVRIHFNVGEWVLLFSIYEFLNWIDQEMNVEWSFYCCCCTCCCWFGPILSLQQQNDTWETTTRTKRSIYIHFCSIIHNSIFFLVLCLFLFMLLCVILLLRQQQNYTWKIRKTRSKKSIYIHFLFNCQSLNLFEVVVVCLMKKVVLCK